MFMVGAFVVLVIVNAWAVRYAHDNMPTGEHEHHFVSQQRGILDAMKKHDDALGILDGRMKRADSAIRDLWEWTGRIDVRLIAVEQRLEDAEMRLDEIQGVK